MNGYEDHTHSFIIKIWTEKTTEETGRITWRGHITHVPDGERRYLKNLDDIQFFIKPYLERVGIQFGLSDRMERWLKRWIG